LLWKPAHCCFLALLSHAQNTPGTLSHAKASMLTNSVLFNAAVATLGKMRHPGAKNLWSVLRCKDPGFVDLLECCLRWDPAERMTPEEAMNHPWVVEPREQQQHASNTHRCADHDFFNTLC
jgi:serine/threonine protein kinase